MPAQMKKFELDEIIFIHILDLWLPPTVSQRVMFFFTLTKYCSVLHVTLCAHQNNLSRHELDTH